MQEKEKKGKETPLKKKTNKVFFRNEPSKKRIRILDKLARKEGGVDIAKAKRFAPSIDYGVTDEQVKQRLEEGLYNATGKKYSKSYKSIFMGNIFTFFNFLCIFAMIALIFSRAPITQYLFVLIFISNIVIGIIQEIRAKVQIERLSILSSSTIKAVRNGVVTNVSTSEIVLDDILILDTGRQVPVDCILLEGAAEVNESLLTGESVAVKKKEGDEILAGSFIGSGSCKVLADKVGKFTYVNSLTSKAKKYKRPNSEIMRSITMFIKVIGILIVPISIGMFLINWGRLSGDYKLFSFDAWFSPHSPERLVLNEVIQKTCAIIVGMIPSGMMLLTSMALAVGVVRLAKKNTLVQDLYSLEMLARVDVLCLDKTGTITDGKMQVASYQVLKNDALFAPPIRYSLEEVMSSFLNAVDDNNQTSIALVNQFGRSAVLTPTETLPFSSKRKYSAVTFEEVGTFVLGAPEFICPKISLALTKIIADHTSQGLRVLLVGYSQGKLTDGVLPTGVRPYALVVLKDNIREDAVASIRWFAQNGVSVKVISGDNPVTVSEVSKRAGIPDAEKCVSLEGLSDFEVQNCVNDYTVFGRVTPEQKAVLVKAIKKAGHTVAMTGDGVNDILALKEADCAVSIATGAEAARNVSHLVLMDNNFNSLPQVVYEGRRVINNIENSASLYLMKTLLIMLLSVFCLVTVRPYFFTTDNMLLFELFVSGIPSFFLSLQPNSKKVEGNFISYVLSHSIPQAITMLICVMTVYFAHSIPAFDGAIFNPETEEIEYRAMMVIIMTLSGVVMLYRICKPFNALRATLFIVVLLVNVCVLTIHYGDFALADLMFKDFHTLTFNAAEILLMVSIIALSFPVSRYVTIFCEIIGKSFEKNELKKASLKNNAKTE